MKFNTGEVGLGVTPESWATDSRVLQFGGLGALWGKSSQAASSAVSLGYNVYDQAANNTGQSYIVTDEASQYKQDDGYHIFYTAASGSADAAISWSDVLCIDTNGNIGMGTTTPDPATGQTYRVLDIRGPSDNNYGGFIRLSLIHI